MLVPQQLLVLPTYRARIATTKGVMVEILGGSRVELLGSGPAEPPGIRLLYGRLVLMPLGRAGTALRLAFGERTMARSRSWIPIPPALDVRLIHAPGTSPEGSAAVVTADLYVPAGSLLGHSRREGAADAEILRSPGFPGQDRLAAGAGQGSAAWIAAKPIGQFDRWASPAVSQSLSTERPARRGLLELMTRPQKDVHWLSLRCLAYVGYFHNLVEAMNDSAHKLVWEEYIDELHAAVARDSDTAAAVRLELESQYPQQAAMLYRMLWGYTDDDLANGEDANLVRALDDDMLAVRRAGHLEPQGYYRLGQSVLPARRHAGSPPAAQAALGRAAAGTRNPRAKRTRRLARRPAHARRSPARRPPPPTDLPGGAPGS